MQGLIFKIARQPISRVKIQDDEKPYGFIHLKNSNFYVR